MSKSKAAVIGTVKDKGNDTVSVLLWAGDAVCLAIEETGPLGTALAAVILTASQLRDHIAHCEAALSRVQP